MIRSHQQFKIIIEQDEDGCFVASVPALPGCHTQAQNLSQLKKRVREVILLALEIAKEDSNYRKAIEEFAYQPNFVGLETITV